MNPTIPRDPATWTLEHAKAAIPATARPVVGQGDPMAYLRGDHWQDGNAYTGPGVDETGKLAGANKTKARRSFVAVPEAEGCISHRVDGACGIQADVSVQPVNPESVDDSGLAVPSDAQTQEAESWRRDIGKWWDRVNLWGGSDFRKPTGVRGMVAYASAHPTGSACLRVFLNPSSLVETGAADGSLRLPRQTDRGAALQHIEVTAPSPDRCAVYTDPDTLQPAGVFLYTDEGNKDWAEVWFARTEAGRRVTVQRNISETIAQERVYPWSGYLPIQQADIGTLLSEPQLTLQGAINHAASSLKRSTEAHGYTSRTEINGADDGAWLTTRPEGVEFPETRVQDGVTLYLNPEPPELGNSVIRKLRGFTYTASIDPDTGKTTEGITTPAVHYHEPSPPENIITALNANITMFREGCRQGHRVSGLSGSTAEASGDAYEQKRAGFEADVRSVAETVDSTVIPLLVCVTLMAEWHTGDDVPTFADDWTVLVQSHPSAGPVSTERQSTTIALKDAEVISPDEATARVGIQDVQGERDRIRQSRPPEKKAEVAKSLIDASADRKASWLAAGFSEKEATDFARSDGQPFVEQ